MRELLPHRRFTEHFELQCGNIKYTVGIGRYADYRVGEIFIDAGKAGTDLRTNTHDMAVAVSIALQHGAKIEDMRKTFARDDTGAPIGILSAVLDYLVENDQAQQQAAE